jgi:hypothetical protein
VRWREARTYASISSMLTRSLVAVPLAVAAESDTPDARSEHLNAASGASN